MVGTSHTEPLRLPVKVAITGTHSTGKTTLLTALAEVLAEHGNRVARVADLGTDAQSAGFPILHNHTAQSTLWIITRGISLELQAELEADVVLVDRPVSDALAYYEAAIHYRHDDDEPEWRAYLGDMTRHYSRTYNVIYKTVLAPSIPLGQDKPRDIDKGFRALADAMVSKTLDSMELSYDELETARFTPYELADQIADSVLRAQAEQS